jgi:hypothetical protein
MYMSWNCGYCGGTVLSPDEYRAPPKSFVVNSMEDMSRVLDIPLNQTDNSTDLLDIDDDMTLSEDTHCENLTGAIKPELPVNNYNVRTLTNEVLAEMRQSNSFSTEWVAVPHHL